jgi:hypothetical protein
VTEGFRELREIEDFPDAADVDDVGKGCQVVVGDDRPGSSGCTCIQDQEDFSRYNRRSLYGTLWRVQLFGDNMVAKVQNLKPGATYAQPLPPQL